MAQTVLQQVLILAAMMMLGFLLGKLGKVERKGADLLSMLLLDVFFPCNILAAASGDFGDMPFSQVIKIALAYMSCFILFTLLAKPIAKLLRLNEDDSLVFTRSVAYPNNGFVGIPLCTAVFGTEGTVLGSLSVPCATLYMFLFIMQSFRREKDHNLKQQLKSMLTPMDISAVLMIIMLATGWKFTGAPLQFLSSMANCVVPTSMLIIGCLLSGSPLIDVLKKPILYLITLLRCLVMPLIAAVILRFTGWNRTVCLCIVMVLGCSVATVISIFGVRYDRSPEMASKSVLQSNLLLPVTMPLMMSIAERIL